MKKKICSIAAALTAVVLTIHGTGISTAAQSGWVLENNNWCYYDNSGNRVTDEWKESNGGWYYLGGDGYMLKNTLIEEDDDYYYVNSSGMMVKSQWKTILNEDREEDEPEYWWYYFRDNGKAWKKTGSNVSLKSIKKADGTIGKYIFDDEGRMQYGWVNDDGEHVPEDDAYKEATYYCGDNGDGSVASNTWARVILEDEVDENGEPDLFGGIVTQDCSCAVYKAPEGREEEYYAEGEKIRRIIFAPVGKTFRITVEQMGMCEPGMVESIGAPMIYAIKLAYDRFVELGVPKDALFSFLMGHLRVQVAITFGLIDAKFSDGAILALENSMNQIFRDGWLDEMVSEEYVTKSILDITAAAGR